MESLLKERETQGDMEERWSRYCRRGRPNETWRRCGVNTAGEGEVHPRRCGGEVETSLQESYRERENQGDMEEIGGVITAGEGEVDP